jgi:hypothetical protein
MRKACRPFGRLFYLVFGVAAILASSAMSQALPATTTISDTVFCRGRNASAGDSINLMAGFHNR